MPAAAAAADSGGAEGKGRTHPGLAQAIPAAAGTRGQQQRAVAGSVLLAGGGVTLIVELARTSFVEAIAALGFALIVAGRLSGSARHRASGLVLAGLGGGLVLAQTAALAAHADALVLGGVGLGLLFVRSQAWAAGRALIVVAVAVAVAADLPAAEPWNTIRNLAVQGWGISAAQAVWGMALVGGALARAMAARRGPVAGAAARPEGVPEPAAPGRPAGRRWR